MKLVESGSSDNDETGTASAAGFNVRADSPQGVVIGDRAVVHQTFSAATPEAQLALHQLPPAPRHFVGREEELLAIEDLLDQHNDGVRIFLISGMAGVGKTALAVHVAHSIAARYMDAQLYLDMNSYDVDQKLSQDNALDRLLRAMGVLSSTIPNSLPDRVSLYRSLITSKRVVLVIDNADDVKQVENLIPGSTTAVVIITSRWNLPGLLAGTGATLIQVKPLSADYSVELLRMIAGSKRIAEEPTESYAVAELCGDLPLALTIAAARLAVRPTMKIAALRQRLSDEEGRLSELEAGDLAVRASLNLSYRGLDERTAEFLRSLGVVPGPEFSVALAAAVSKSTDNDAARLLEDLVDAHLLQATKTPGRYRLHDLVLAFCRDCLRAETDSKGIKTTQERVFQWYLDMLMAAERRVISPRRRPWDEKESPRESLESREEALDWFEQERENVLGAIKQANRSGSHQYCWMLADGAWAFYQLHKHWEDWKVSHVLGLASARESTDPQGEAWMLTGLGGVEWELEEYDAAVQHLESALRLHKLNHDGPGESRTLLNIGFARYHMGHILEAIDATNMSLQIARDGNDSYRVGWALYSLSRCHASLDQWAVALERCDESLQVWQAMSNRMAEAFTLNYLGVINRHLGKLSESDQILRDAWEIRKEVRDRYGEGMTLDSLGDTIEQLKGRRKAIGYWKKSAEILESLGAPEAPAVRKKLRPPSASASEH